MLKNIIIFILAAILGWNYFQSTQTSSNEHSPATQIQTKDEHNLSQENIDNSIIADAFNHRKSNVWVTGKGTIKKLLADDNQGSRHQRFILDLGNGQTLLFAHNIDLSPKIINLKPGDSLSFRGEYIFNKQGGIIHWTHHDPQKRHEGGWLKHNGIIYQ